MRRIDLTKASVARSNTIRDINRQIVLNYVREKGPISRAEIARVTDLQRSTISLIVDELRGYGLIKEVSGESTGGRPPVLFSLHTANPVAIGVDLGAIRTTVATCDLSGGILEQEEFPSNPNVDETTSLIIGAIEKILRRKGSKIEGIGISIPALVDAKKERILFSPHFRWEKPKIIEKLKSATGIPVKVDNDANAAALAELWFGRPEIRDVRDFIMVYIENGIGTGIVFDGQIHRGKGGIAGEFGHMTIGEGAPIACAAGKTDCWEAFASERAALARYAKLNSKNGAKRDINFVELVKLAFQNDKKALVALKETAHFMGVGMANLIQGLSPEAIIVGGSIVQAWNLIVDDIYSGVENSVCQGVPPIKIIPSTLGSKPTLLGAFSLVLADKFASISIA